MAEDNKMNEQAANTQPEDNGAGKTFTQDEVNRIVSDRLARERAKHDGEGNAPAQDAVAEREKQITIRENKMACKEYVMDKGYPQELLEVLNTDSKDDFVKLVEKLIKIFPNPTEPINNAVGVSNGGFSIKDPFADIFKPKK